MNITAQKLFFLTFQDHIKNCTCYKICDLYNHQYGLYLQVTSSSLMDPAGIQTWVPSYELDTKQQRFHLSYKTQIHKDQVSWSTKPGVNILHLKIHGYHFLEIGALDLALRTSGKTHPMF